MTLERRPLRPVCATTALWGIPQQGHPFLAAHDIRRGKRATRALRINASCAKSKQTGMEVGFTEVLVVGKKKRTYLPEPPLRGVFFPIVKDKVECGPIFFGGLVVG